MVPKKKRKKQYIDGNMFLWWDVSLITNKSTVRGILPEKLNEWFPFQYKMPGQLGRDFLIEDVNAIAQESCNGGLFTSAFLATSIIETQVIVMFEDKEDLIYFTLKI